MINTKLGDKELLCEYDLDTELFKRFNLKVLDIVPIRNNYIICTDKGNKILKKANCSIEELNFINSSVKYINKNFNRTMKFMPDINDKIYTIWDKNIYCVMDIIGGKECEYNNPVDIILASKALAQFHKAGEGIANYVNLNSRNYTGKLIDLLKRKKDEMYFFKNIANLYEEKTEFDRIFLENIDFYLDQTDKSINLLNNSKYFKLCSEEEKIVLCHHDLAHHNIIINNNNAFFIDFDYSIIDLKVHDLCNFMIKILKNCYFDVDKTYIILNNYSKYNSLDTKELEVLYALLTFPEDIYSISKDYYTRRKKRPLEANISKLQRKLNFKEPCIDFLRHFEVHYIK